MKRHLLLLAVALMLSTFHAGAQGTQARAEFKDRKDFERWMRDLSNWGRWGKDDQRGALNLVTPAKRKQALGLVRDGVSVSLARNVEKEKAVDNGAPFQHLMERSGTNNSEFFSADLFKVSYHGMVHTHIDSLCHMFHQGRMYNGFLQTEVTADGAHKLDILHLKNGLVSRAVLMDIPALKGVDYLEPGTPIYPEDLDAWEKRAGVKVGPGDIVLIRTGRWARRAKMGPWSGTFAGLHGSCARWLKDRDVAVLGSDAASDVIPSGVTDVPMPIHQLSLIAMGTWILDNCDLEAVSIAARERGRWEFMLFVAPLAVPGGTGSPINPIATF